MPNRQPASRFRLLRYFSLTSLLSVLVVAILVFGFYRYMVIDTITEFGASLDSFVAKTALTFLEEDLAVALRQPGASSNVEVSPPFTDGHLLDRLGRLRDGVAIAKIKIYSPVGIVVYSSKPVEIGQNQGDNPGFSTAMKGKIATKLIYRDHLNPFDHETSDDNLIQTYLPIFDKDLRRPVGVFEVYSDANDIVRDAERTQLMIVPVITAILAILYISLVAIVRRADAILQHQANVIAERTHTLEVLSARLLKAQEDERKRLAETLHERVAQSLVAIKLLLEKEGGNHDSAALIPLVQDAIHHTRELAVDLRPPALDDFGAVEALTSFFRELSKENADRSLTWEHSIEESDLPRPLKTIIYRIAQDTLRSLLNDTEADNIRVSLGRTNGEIVLAITENAYAYGSTADAVGPDEALNPAIIPMRERTIMSGGDFRVEKTAAGTTKNIAAWPIELMP